MVIADPVAAAEATLVDAAASCLLLNDEVGTSCRKEGGGVWRNGRVRCIVLRLTGRIEEVGMGRSRRGLRRAWMDGGILGRRLGGDREIGMGDDVMNLMI